MFVCTPEYIQTFTVVIDLFQRRFPLVLEGVAVLTVNTVHILAVLM